MRVAIVTGSGGLVGSSAALRFAVDADLVVGIDNNMRTELFGVSGSVAPNIAELRDRLDHGYEHLDVDIRDTSEIDRVMRRFGQDLSVIVHTAAQPSHDYAAQVPQTDFSINAVGTFNLLESMRRHAPEAVFIFTSTSKVYGDHPNRLPLVEMKTRWDLPEAHELYHGIPETASIDQSVHSLFGASKLCADVMVQEYGRYFGLKTGVFRAGCITGGRHAGVEQHGFLSHLVRTVVADETYTIFGHGGKQVRDNIHAADLVEAFALFCTDPDPGAVFNIGGGRTCNCSVLEALVHTGRIASCEPATEYTETPRKGDHVWYISDRAKLESRYPQWSPKYDLESILEELVEAAVSSGQANRI